MGVLLSRRADKDLRRIGPGKDLDRIEQRFSQIDIAMGGGNKPPSTKALTSTRSITVLSTRTGDYRILWTADGGDAVIIRVIHRSDLDRVAESL